VGDQRKDALRVTFDQKVKLEFHGTKVTSDAGLPAYRELDEMLGSTTMIDSDFCDTRTGKNTQHSFTVLLRQSIYSRLGGYACRKRCRDDHEHLRNHLKRKETTEEVCPRGRKCAFPSLRRRAWTQFGGVRKGWERREFACRSATARYNHGNG
jgi:hypothetical protein